MPSADIDAIESDSPGFILTRLAAQTSRINARLRKVCPVPFVAPVPEVVLEWLNKTVTYECYLKRGVDPSDQTIAHVKADKELADAETKEAADGNTGLFDLPVNDSLDASAKTKAAPVAYVEASPYAWTDKQRTSGSVEDSNRGR